MKTALVSIILIFFICTTACAWDLVSEPSPQNATYWKVVLDNGTQYTGKTVNGSLHWNVDGMAAGEYTGDAYFGEEEWKLSAENSTNETGMVWSDPTPFTLQRNPAPDQPSKIHLEE